MKIHIVIPARHGSSRLPGKPLLEILGKPLIWYVYQRAIETGLSSITVATDHEDIFDAVINFGGNAVMTSATHLNGTDRLAEVSEKLGFGSNDIVINLQGDEPLLPSELIHKLPKLLADNHLAGIATLCCPILDKSTVLNPNVVKVTKTDAGKALYFSRAPIPWDREHFNDDKNVALMFPYYRHIGLYAYRVNTLMKISNLQESTLERCESLEQLRALQAGIDIQVGVISEMPPHGVDTMDDYLAVKKIVENSNES